MRPFLPFLLSLSAVLAAGCTDTPTQAVPHATQPAQSPAPQTPSAPKTITVIGAGDVLVHPEVSAQAAKDGNWAAMFGGVRPAIEGADLALCHMETPLAKAGGPFTGFPRFSVPPQVLGGLKETGFDGCSTASNHSLDQGEEGIDRTVAAFDAAGLGHTGTYASAKDREKPAFYEVGGVKIAHLSYAFGFNGLTAPAGKDWLANRIDPKKILAAAHKARLAGARIVILSLHWGTEYRHDPDADQLRWAGQLAGSPDIDLVYGHHAHVVQPIRKIKGTWFVFGMGNELARHAEPIDANREGLMVRATFTETAGKWAVSKIEPLPTWVDLGPAIRIIDLTSALAAPSLGTAQRKTYQAAYNRVMKEAG
jgi:poly-gamma-glutamate capsule biosynthesis protein CapA/YwtB (metallophosphatase superfamily)